jgi:hypothetical protein
MVLLQAVVVAVELNISEVAWVEEVVAGVATQDLGELPQPGKEIMVAKAMLLEVVVGVAVPVVSVEQEHQLLEVMAATGF